ncbi:hypothetical protein, partial [uncultured Desulfovibrio sp.]|uniref:hypothetical protein n=1 Tax=uncultured Desulfovibrio sp. TaxID=167968 RepID=UPI00262C25CB
LPGSLNDLDQIVCKHTLVERSFSEHFADAYKSSYNGSGNGQKTSDDATDAGKAALTDNPGKEKSAEAATGCGCPEIRFLTCKKNHLLRKFSQNLVAPTRGACPMRSPP